MRRVLTALLAAAALAPTGCGGDDDDDGTSVKGLPKPAQPLSAAVRQLEQVSSGPCQRFLTIVHTRSRRANTPPGSPGTAQECEGSNLGEFAGFRAEKTKQFGTAAVVDGRTNRRSQVSLIFVLDGDSRWRFLFKSLVAPSREDPDIRQVGSKPRDEDRFDENVRAFVRGFQTRDCPAIWKALSGSSGIVSVRKNNQAAFCRDLNRSYANAGTFPSLMLQSRNAKPELLGETSDNAFYALKLARGNVFTLVLSTDPDNIDPSQKRGHDNDGVIDYFRAGPRR